jgi:5-methyltetrahydropteroyltriglutamate--homocysteine methyltransferase
VEELRSDVVGSLLRPPELLEARERHERGEMSAEQLRVAENAAVDACLRFQGECGLDVVNDGEMRRTSFQSQVTEAFEGFSEHGLEAWLWGRWRGRGDVGDRDVERPPLAVVSELRRRRFPAVEELEYARERTDRGLKVTLPSPSLFASFYDPDRAPSGYPTVNEYLSHLADLMREEVDELVRCGASYVQIDAPHYTMFVDPEYRDFYASRGIAAEQWIESGIELDNHVIGDRPDVTTAFHLCRGNQESRWLVEGGYDELAATIFPKIKADRLMLEYDDERSGGFEPLEALPEDKTVVLGLVTTKTGELEPLEGLVARVKEASGYVPLERLAVSTQCGFATSVLGNALTHEEQGAKLRRVVDVANAVWG